MKSVLITGCSSGFGRGMVDEFLKSGWHVFGTMRNVNQRRDIFTETLEKYPYQLTLLELEVTNFEQICDVVKIIQQNSGLDCLVNNAGFGLLGALEDLSEEQIRYQMEVNFYAPVFLTRALLPLLRQRKGKVIFISSVCGNVSFPLMSDYCASKHAVEGFAESLYYELEPHGVEVTLIRLGLSKTNFTKNVVWGVEQNQVYRLQTENYQRWRDELNLKAKNNTYVVAQKIIDIAEKGHDQLRVWIGEEANLTQLFQRLLPEKIWLSLLKILFHRKLG